MKAFSEILSSMAEDKNIKTVSVELKRMSNGIRISYETRIGDETRMGLEFVNSKDFEASKDELDRIHDDVVSKIENLCKQKRET